MRRPVHSAHVTGVVLAMLAVGTLRAQASTDTARRDVAVFVVPALGMAPETGFLYGISAIRVSRPPRDSVTRPMEWRLYAAYTTRQQFSTYVEMEWWSYANRWRVSADLEWRKFPLPFYGIGDQAPATAEERYTSTGTLGYVAVQRQVVARLYVLGGLRWWNQTLSSATAGGMLAAGIPTGATGGSVMLAQVGAVWDSRDPLYAPQRGAYLQVAWSQADRLIGSDFTFRRATLDARRYVALGPQLVVAFQVVAEHNFGDAPFDQLALVGGARMLRGYTQGRYRDRFLLAGQAEVRAPLWRRLSAVAFAGAGAVAPAPRLLGRAMILPSVGAGLRYEIPGASGARARLDVAFGRDARGVYLGFQEAF